MTGVKKSDKSKKDEKAKKTVGASKEKKIQDSEKKGSLAGTRPSKKELKEATENTMKKYKIAIKKLSQR